MANARTENAVRLGFAADSLVLRLAPLDDSGTLIRKHFLQLDGLGVRDLRFAGDDLSILAGPTDDAPGTDRKDGEHAVFCELLRRA